MKAISKIILIFSILSYSSNAYSQKEFVEVYKLYSDGAYQQVIEALERVNSKSKEVISTKFYLKAISHNKLQQFDKSISAFIRAIKAGNKSEDIYYEYGQALYAANELSKAKLAFKKSYKINYKKTTSLYYVAHISQILEEHKQAKIFYTKILKDDKTDTKMRQISRFQRSEVLLSMSRERSNVDKLVEKYILPEYKKALAIDPESSIAIEIKQKISQLQAEFNLDPNKMRNGRYVSTKRFSGYISEKIDHDDNITLANDQATVTTTKRDSYILNTTVFAKYIIPSKRRYLFNPEIRYAHVHHMNRDHADVFQNDSYTFAPALRATYEHTAYKKPASLIYEIEYNYVARDKNSIQDREKFATSYLYVIGEKVSFSKYGDTTFKFKYKTYRSFNPQLDSNIKTLSIDQTAIFSNGHVFVVLGQADFTDSFNNTNNSTTSYLMNGTYIISNIFTKTNLDLSYSLTLLDTKEQKATRGLEKTNNISMKFSRIISNSFKINLGYAYTNNGSKSESNEYTKKIIHLEARYNF